MATNTQHISALMTDLDAERSVLPPSTSTGRRMEHSSTNEVMGSPLPPQRGGNIRIVRQQEPTSRTRQSRLAPANFDNDRCSGNATCRSSSLSRRSRDTLPNETVDYQFSRSQELLQQMHLCSQDLTPPYPTELSLSGSPSSRDSTHMGQGHVHRGRSELFEVPRVERLERYEPTEYHVRTPVGRRFVTRHVDLPWQEMGVTPRGSIPVKNRKFAETHGHRASSSVCFTISDSVSGPFADESRASDSGTGTATSSSSSAADDIIIDVNDMAESDSTIHGLSKNVRDLPLASRSSAAIFTEAQIGLERLLLDLEFLEEDDNIPDHLSATSGSGSETSTENFEAQDPCDGHEQRSCSGDREAGNQQPSSDHTGAPGQEHQTSSHKRQRLDDDPEDLSRAILKARRKAPASTREQMLICCFRGDPQNPCLGTDRSIGEVIDRLASCHHIYICKTCYALLVENSSGGNVHPTGVDCIEHCLSPRCLEDSTTADSQVHRFNAKTCGTKTTRSRPEDRESIFRYIFRLVNSAKEIPDNVFTMEKNVHTGMKSRQRRHAPTRDELLSRAQELTEQFEELRRRDSASTKEIQVLTREVETGRTKITSLEEKVQRLQDIITDTLRPSALSDEHWRRSIHQRVKSDAPDALENASTNSQTLQTPHGSLRDSQGSGTGHYESCQDPGLVSSSNDIVGYRCSRKVLGKRPAIYPTSGSKLDGLTFPDRTATRDDINHATMTAPSGLTTASADFPATALSEHLPGPYRQWHQDTPSGGLGFQSDLIDTIEMQYGGAKAVTSSSGSLQNQEPWTEEMWDEYIGNSI